MKTKKNKGFSLIELMISVAIMSFLLMLAAPSFSEWMAGLRVRNTAESVNFAILQARSEAIRRNQNINFTLNNDTSWSISTEDGTIINKKDAPESSAGVNVTVNPADGNSISFTGMGLLSATTVGVPPISLDFSSASTYDIKTLRVKVGSGGASLVCQSAETNADSPNFCRDI